METQSPTNGIPEFAGELNSLILDACNSLNARGGFVFLVIPEEFRLKLVAKAGKDLSGTPPVEMEIRPNDGVAGRIFATLEPMIVHDYRKWAGRSLIEMGATSSHAVCGSPIFLGKHALGAMMVIADEKRPNFESKDMEAMMTFSRRAASVLGISLNYQLKADTRDLVYAIDLPWQEIGRYFSRNPDELHRIPPRTFEQLVAEIFASHGWQVDLTSRTRDGGHDIVAVRRSGPSDLKVLVEAKRYSPDRRVGVDIVRSLYGVRQLEKASQVVLATTSYVSKDAKLQFSQVIPWELDFFERDKILEWCGRHGSVEVHGFSDEKK